MENARIIVSEWENELETADDSLMAHTRIIKGLKDHTVLSRKQIDELLWSKLSIDYTDEQKSVKIKNLLAKMRKQHIIEVGEDRLWHLCSV